MRNSSCCCRGSAFCATCMEDIVAENVNRDGEPDAVLQLANARLDCTRSLIVNFRELTPRKPTPRTR